MRNRYGQIDYTHTFAPNLLVEGGFAFASVGGANGQDANLKVPNISIIDGTQGVRCWWRLAGDLENIADRITIGALS
jgi:hypothetical protein